MHKIKGIASGRCKNNAAVNDMNENRECAGHLKSTGRRCFSRIYCFGKRVQNADYTRGEGGENVGPGVYWDSEHCELGQKTSTVPQAWEVAKERRSEH